MYDDDIIETPIRLDCLIDCLRERKFVSFKTYVEFMYANTYHIFL